MLAEKHVTSRALSKLARRPEGLPRLVRCDCLILKVLLYVVTCRISRWYQSVVGCGFDRLLRSWRVFGPYRGYTVKLRLVRADRYIVSSRASARAVPAVVAASDKPTTQNSKELVCG